MSAVATAQAKVDVRRRTFTALVVGFLIFLYLFSPFSSIFLGWFVDFEDDIDHRVHEVAFGAFFALMLLSIALQLRSPEKNIAGLQVAVAAAGILTLVVALSTGWEWGSLFYLVPVVAIAGLHPRSPDLLRLRFRPKQHLLALMILATVPLVDMASREFTKAVNEAQFHTQHWGGMAVFALTILIGGYIAVVQPRGWRVVAWSIALAMIIYGAASLSFPFDASSRPNFQGTFIVIWGLLFATATEFHTREARRETSDEPVDREEPEPDLVDETQGPTVLRRVRKRARKGRIIGGVAAGIARYLGISPGYVRAAFAALTPLFALGPLLYLLGWWRIPLEQPGDPVGLHRPTPNGWRRRINIRVLITVPLVAAGLVLGFFIYGAARDFNAPPVPHVIESLSPRSCVDCHATGSQGATQIDPSVHQCFGPGCPRSGLPFCVNCHDHRGITRDTGTASPAHGRVGPSLLLADHPQVDLLGSADLDEARARLVEPESEGAAR